CSAWDTSLSIVF
nr:immunoglobulin light chain junction region [Macaca mulatta]